MGPEIIGKLYLQMFSTDILPSTAPLDGVFSDAKSFLY